MSSLEQAGDGPAADTTSTLAGHQPASRPSEADKIKLVPQDSDTRTTIRELAVELAADLDRTVPPAFDDLLSAGEEVLERLSLPEKFLGFAMVAVDNAFWAADFEAVAFDRRLLLLPKCLSDKAACQGYYDSVGLHCAGCGACVICDLKQQAEELGYEVIIAEGTASVVMKVLEGGADAILGVACLDSLDESFEQISALGVPHHAIPLLSDGCEDTTAEVGLIREMITARRAQESGTHSTAGGVRSYLPLLRATRDIFEPDMLAEILDPCACPSVAHAQAHSALAATDEIARDWLQRGGKRLRPFITLSAYAVGRHGLAALAPDAELATFIPPAIRQIAVAIETLHKASLVHDDIEDKDPFRYGQPTLHRTYGIAAAINVGDYLVGLGYRLIAAQAAELGAECIADILGRLSAAHLQLCCGQGMELLWNRQRADGLRPIDALQIGALKTAPAFEVALYAGLRAAETTIDDAVLNRLATYIGEGYQVLDDLTDWEEDADDKVALGQDLLAGRPTILRAFALEAGGGEELAALLEEKRMQDEPVPLVDRARHVYADLGAFDKAEKLYSRLRERSLGLAESMPGPALQELTRFLVRNILPERKHALRADGDGPGRQSFSEGG